MAVTRVDQLLQSEAMSRGRLDDALGAVPCRAALRSAVRDAIIAGLPAALDVDIADCVRWRVPARPKMPVRTCSVAFTLRPGFEWTEPATARRQGVVVVAEVELVARDGGACWSGTSPGLDFAPETAWSASMRLGIGPRDGGTAIAWFHEQESVVHLAPWDT